MPQPQQGGFIGWMTAEPTTAELQEGDFYFNTVTFKWRVIHNNAFQDISGGAGSTITPYDNTDAAASVAAGATVTVRTITGKGTSTIVVKGDGGADVTMKYSVDGAADVAVGAATAEALVPVAFSSSLAIKATNAGGSPESYSTVSSTGVYA